MEGRKLKDLKRGDKLVCLRISDDNFVHFNIEVQNVDRHRFHVRSENLDRYTFTRIDENNINGLRVVLDDGGDLEYYDFEEYLFESLEDCKKFAKEYCEKKINTYKNINNLIDSW